MQKVSITKKGLTAILVNSIVIKLFLTFGHISAENSGSGAWVEAIYVSLAAAVLYYITYRLYRVCGKSDLTDLAQKAGGNVLRIIVGVVICAVLTANICMTARVVPESVKLYLLPSTPSAVILLGLGTAVVIGTYNGIEALGRLHALFIPLAGVIMAVFFLLVLPQCHISNLFPIMGTGTYNVFVRGFNRISIFADILLLYILLPYCKSAQTAFVCGRRAIVAGGICASAISLIYCAVYPYPLSADFMMPVYQLMRLVRIGDFFQRAESVFEFIWLIAALMYISVYASVICLVWQKTFRLKYHHPLIVPVVISIVSLALLPNSSGVMQTGEKIIKNSVYPIAFALPIILSLLYVYKVRGRKKG